MVRGGSLSGSRYKFFQSDSVLENKDFFLFLRKFFAPMNAVCQCSFVVMDFN